MRLLSSIIGILFIVLLILFSVSNLGNVNVTFWPFPINVTAPLFAVILGTAVISFLLGALFVWLSDVSDMFTSYFEKKSLAKQLKKQKQAKNEPTQTEGKI